MRNSNCKLVKYKDINEHILSSGNYTSLVRVDNEDIEKFLKSYGYKIVDIGTYQNRIEYNLVKSTNKIDNPINESLFYAREIQFFNQYGYLR